MYGTELIENIKADPEWRRDATSGLLSRIAYLEAQVSAFQRAESFEVKAIIWGTPTGNGISTYTMGEWRFEAGDRFNEPDDPELRGVSSLKLLRESYDRVRALGWRLVNADLVLIGNEPRIAPLREEMQAALLAAIGEGRVTVRATTTDELGFTGRGEGLAAQAVALLERVA